MGVAQNTVQQYSQNNQEKSLLDKTLEYIKDNATDLTGSMNTFFNELADNGCTKLYGEKGGLLEIYTRALRNALQVKFIAADIALAYISYKQMINEGNPPEEALGETLAKFEVMLNGKSI